MDQLTKRRAFGTTILLLGLAATGATAWAGGGVVDKDQTKDKVFVGYVYGRTRDVPYHLYTHLCHAFLVADGEGRVQARGDVPERELIAEAHAAGVKVLISLGGWGWDKQFAAIVASPEAEDRYVDGVMDVVRRGDYDGIDLDWEYPDTRDEVVGFERLVRRLRTKLDARARETGRPMLVTMAASANPGTLKWLGKDFLLETMDWINVMTYDMAGDWTPYAGHHSPLHASSKTAAATGRSSEATINFLLEDRGLPADRVALGIPLYGRGFAVGEPYAPTKDAPKVRIPQGNYSNLHRLREQDGWTRIWDDETKNPWLVAPDRSIVIGYDDAESIALKTEWAMRKGLRGVFFWQVAADRLPDGSHPLQQAARAKLDAARKNR